MKVMTFSREFPATHPRKGVKTFFPEMILCQLGVTINQVGEAFKPYLNDFAMLEGKTKGHTIRAGNRWKAGDMMSCRIWTGKPYRSPQVEFSQLEVKKVWTFEMLGMTILLNDKPVNCLTLAEIAENDGLSLQEFKDWFKKVPFVGQIICWNKTIEY